MGTAYEGVRRRGRAWGAQTEECHEEVEEGHWTGRKAEDRVPHERHLRVGRHHHRASIRLRLVGHDREPRCLPHCHPVGAGHISLATPHPGTPRRRPMLGLSAARGLLICLPSPLHSLARTTRGIATGGGRAEEGCGRGGGRREDQIGYPRQ